MGARGRSLPRGLVHFALCTRLYSVPGAANCVQVDQDIGCTRFGETAELYKNAT